VSKPAHRLQAAILSCSGTQRTVKPEFPISDLSARNHVPPTKRGVVRSGAVPRLSFLTYMFFDYSRAPAPGISWAFCRGVDFANNSIPFG
jgi:hypothetical protein